MGDKEKPPHFIHEIKENGYVVIGGNVFPRKIMISPRKKGVYLLRSILLTHKSSSRGRLLYFRSLHRCSSLRLYFLPFVLFHYFLFVLDIFSDTHVRIGIQIASPLVNMLYWPSADSSSARLFGTIMFTTGLTIAWAWELGEADGASGTVTCVLSSNLFSERISSEMEF